MRRGLSFLLSDFKEIPPPLELLLAHPPSWQTRRSPCQGWGGRGKPTMGSLGVTASGTIQVSLRSSQVFLLTAVGVDCIF